jgi:hypothetical protein
LSTEEKKINMGKKKTKLDEAADIPRFRQIQVVGLNESVNLISNYEHEDMAYLSGKALRIYRKIRTPKGE